MSSITFVCGTPHGGALDSTVSLAACAIAAGHEVTVVVAAHDSYSRLPRIQGMLVRLARLSRWLGAVGWWVHDRCSAATVPEMIGGVRVLRAVDVAAATRRHHDSGGLLVVNSVRRLDLTRLVGAAARSSSRIVWYLREATSLAFAADLGSQVDLLVANARPLASEVERLVGHPCPYVPSVISREGLVEPEVRRSLLLVNAKPAFGVEEAIAIARAMPDQHVVLQESWPLDEDERERLLSSVSELANVEFRSRAPRSEVYRDARLLIVPTSPEAVGLNRPRVVIESQAVGIPVIAQDVAGLASAVASPELLVPVGGDAAAWAERIRTADGHYDIFEARARAFAALELLSPDEVWEAFRVACGDAL